MTAHQSPSVAIAILNFNSLDDTLECIQAVKASNYSNQSVLVLDNNSNNNEGLKLKNLLPPAEFVQIEKNIGYAGGNNIAIKRAIETKKKYILLLNPDVRIQPTTIAHYVSILENQEEAAALNSIQLSDDQGSIDEKFLAGAFAGRTDVGRDFANSTDALTINVDNLFGAALFIRVSALKRIGGFDPLYFAYSEETDLCRRLRLHNYALLITNKEPILHIRTNEKSSSIDDFRLYLRLKGHYVFTLKSPYTRFKSSLGYTFRSIVKALLGMKQPGYPFDRFDIRPKHALRAATWLLVHGHTVYTHRKNDIELSSYKNSTPY